MQRSQRTIAASAGSEDGRGHPPGYEGKGSFSKLKIARNLILPEPAERNVALLTP